MGAKDGSGIPTVRTERAYTIPELRRRIAYAIEIGSMDLVTIEEDLLQLDTDLVELTALREENARLRKALKTHKHTDECLRYASHRGVPFGCIPECRDSYEAALKEDS